MNSLTQTYSIETGELSDSEQVERRLSQLGGCFRDEGAFESTLSESDPLVYKVKSLECGNGDGDLHYGLGTLYPGKVGNEFFLTKGHLHSRRETAEVYIGLEGEGYMILEHEKTGETRFEPLGKDKIVYVPGYWAHRTVNTGEKPLVYIGVYPADAGHDYGAIKEKNFKKVILEENNQIVFKDR